jgi:hypothetical protein
MASSECLPARLNPLAEKTCFYQVPVSLWWHGQDPLLRLHDIAAVIRCCMISMKNILRADAYPVISLCALRNDECPRRPSKPERLPVHGRCAERETRQVGPEVGPTPAISSCIPTGMHGPTCIFWVNLTPFPLRALRRVRYCVEVQKVDLSAVNRTPSGVLPVKRQSSPRW